MTLIIIIFLLIAFSAILMLFNPAVKLKYFEEFDPGKIASSSRTVSIIGINDEIIAGNLCDNKPYCNIDSLNKNTLNSFIAIEDKRFYSHNGVDYFRILGALKNNIKRGRFAEGASTITQQLVKNTHLSQEKTIKRKINEIRIAKEVEKVYSKREILEKYLNVVYFGNGCYGIESAAQCYFGKPAKSLTLEESAFLAGIINNPSKYDPYNHYENAVARQNTVLKRMLEQNLVEFEEYQKAVNANPTFISSKSERKAFINSVIREACERLGITRNELYAGNYAIYTSFDSDLFEKSSSILRNHSIDNAFTELIIVENDSGNCIVKSMDNISLNVYRQPGSTIKPFLSYAPALEKRLVYPISPILDEKINYDGYSPSNHDGKYHGWISIKDALVNSYNIPAVKLLNMNGIEYSKNLANKFGIDFAHDDNSLSLALGGFSKGVTLDMLSQGYMTLARGGTTGKLTYINKICNNKGDVVYKRNNEMTEQVVGSDTAYLLTDMMAECAKNGTAKRVNSENKFRVAAKTGTVGTKNGNSDAYCIAYTPKYTTAVRISALRGALPNEISGATVPASIIHEIIGLLGDDSDFTIPESVVCIDLMKNELEKNKKIIPAVCNSAGREKISALFSRNNIPFMLPEMEHSGSKLDNFDDFDIPDGIFY